MPAVSTTQRDLTQALATTMKELVCVVIGNQRFLHDAAIPAMDDLADIDSLHLPEGYDIGVSSEPRFMAAATEVSGWLVPVLFIGSWAAGKALDELYTRVIPVLKKHLLPLYAKRGSNYAISFVINKAPENVSILIVAIGESEQELSAAESLVPKVVPSALLFAQSAPMTKQTHLYTIRAGKVEVAPAIFSSLPEALSSLSSMVAAKAPRVVRTRRAGSSPPAD